MSAGPGTCRLHCRFAQVVVGDRTETDCSQRAGPQPGLRLHTCAMVFTDAEYAYLAGHPSGRLATIGPDGALQVHPVALWLNEAAGTIDIGGPALATSQKFRNVQADPRISLVVDDQAATPIPSARPGVASRSAARPRS